MTDANASSKRITRITLELTEDDQMAIGVMLGAALMLTARRREPGMYAQVLEVGNKIHMANDVAWRALRAEATVGSPP